MTIRIMVCRKAWGRAGCCISGHGALEVWVAVVDREKWMVQNWGVGHSSDPPIGRSGSALSTT